MNCFWLIYIYLNDSGILCNFRYWATGLPLSDSICGMHSQLQVGMHLICLCSNSSYCQYIVYSCLLSSPEFHSSFHKKIHFWDITPNTNFWFFQKVTISSCVKRSWVSQPTWQIRTSSHITRCTPSVPMTPLRGGGWIRDLRYKILF